MYISEGKSEGKYQKENLKRIQNSHASTAHTGMATQAQDTKHTVT
jgi:hypothetical protein